MGLLEEKSSDRYLSLWWLYNVVLVCVLLQLVF